MIVADRR